MTTTPWNIGLKRNRNQCWSCSPEVQDSVRCYQHPQTRGVLFTYIREFCFLEATGRNKLWSLSQSIRKEVFCPKANLCHQVIKD